MSSEQLLTVEIVTPRRVVFSGHAAAVTLPGVKGGFQVLINHAPIVSSLDIGEIKITAQDGSEMHYATDGGFAEVLRNTISVIVETAEEASEINTEPLRKQRALLVERLEGEKIYALRDETKRRIQEIDNRLKIAERQ